MLFPISINHLLHVFIMVIFVMLELWKNQGFYNRLKWVVRSVKWVVRSLKWSLKGFAWKNFIEDLENVTLQILLARFTLLIIKWMEQNIERGF